MKTAWYMAGKLAFSFLTALVLCAVTYSAAWAAPSISMQVDRDTITIDDTLRLTITIQGGSALTRPHIPPKGNFEVVQQSSGNAIEIVNGQMSVTNTFQYLLKPRSKGKFEIGPVEAHIDGQTYSAGPVKVEVLEDQQQSLPYQVTPPSPPPNYTQPNFPPSPNLPWTQPSFPQTPPPPPAAGETFLTAQVDKTEAYVGEQILYTFRLYSAVSLQSAQLKLPEFKEFVSEELIQERKFETDINGRRYAVNEWRLALFPTKAGSLHTGKAQVEAQVLVRNSRDRFADPFFRMPFRQSWEEKSFSSKDLTIEVKELPPAPPNFTGLVGQFQISSHLDQSQVRTGETAYLKATISGEGNIKDAKLNGLKDTSELKVYPSAPKTDVKKSLQGLSGTKTFEFALVPSRPGTSSIGPLSTAYFNPKTGEYDSLEVPKQVLEVKGAATQEALVTAGIGGKGDSASVASLRRILREIKTPGALLSRQMPPLWLRILAWVFIAGFPLIYLFLSWYRRHQERMAARSEDRKRSSAFRRAKGALQEIKDGMGTETCSALSQVMRNYLGDVFTIKGLALTPGEVEDLLKQKGVPADRLRRMVYLLEQLDQWKYSGRGESLKDLKTTKQEILDSLREVEKVLSK